MPAAYAHYRFGQAVFSRLPQEKQSTIQAHRPLYDLGLHGPDLLFYYRPLSHDPLKHLGSAMHQAAAADFFRPAGELLGRAQDSEALTAYLWGFLCHFALDLHCHAYIAASTAGDGPGHFEMEADFDRALLREAGLALVPGNVTGHIKPSRAAMRLLSPLFSGVSPRKLYRAAREMIVNLYFLNSQNRPLRALVKTALQISGRYEKLGPMLLPDQPNPRCAESSRKLMSLYTQAQDTAVRLIQDFADNAQGRRDYDLLYQYNFDGQLKEETP
ncbi:MAG: zinc dependent phospholipase C family protein [Candidatus Limivicinus sp.]